MSVWFSCSLARRCVELQRLGSWLRPRFKSGLDRLQGQTGRTRADLLGAKGVVESGMVKGHFSDVKAEPATLAGAQATIRWLIAPKEGARNFAMRVIELGRSGDRIPLHSHGYEHEIFVFEGEGRVLKPGGEEPVGPGDFLYVEPDEEHGFVNSGVEPFRFICVIPLPQ